MELIGQSVLTGAGMLWKALWALIFGYIVSAGIQVLVSRQSMASLLGERGVQETALSSFFGFISSSCSFAALAASRTVLAKGAHPTNALSFLVASTNLVIELGIVLWVLVGWRFMLGNIVLGLLMIVYASLITRVWLPQALVSRGKENAERAQESDGDDHEALEGSIIDNLLSIDGWRHIAHAFVMEWKMVWKELVFGFTVAGFISVMVPQSFWNMIFLIEGGQPDDSPGVLLVLENALVAPLVAFCTFIGSMGNVPLAAMLWSKGASFGGIMSFLGADLVAATVIWVHAKYYGWRYALYTSAVLYAAMVLAGVTVHYLFDLIGQIPDARPELSEMVRFGVDYTLFLNLAFGAIAFVMVVLHLGGMGRETVATRK